MADSRWVLARERTQLAWARFSVACSLVAIALVVFVPREVPTVLVVVPGGLIALGALVAALRLFRA
ncbi:DUF202 domain-containing protein [Actinomycetospora atypica]|uniref:DUF202 domain-containing protein n=1 Tax=Actinomycetospora atypica TaxID=1290095 RepID=A0ABV9YEF8_9PSEU